MSKQITTIDINGQRYDIATGMAVDGSVVATIPLNKTAIMAVQKPSLQDVVRQPAKTTGKQRQTSKTLMRHAVHKPAPQPVAGLKAQPGQGGLAKQSPIGLKKASAQGVDTNRLARAQATDRHQSIQRHHQPAPIVALPVSLPPAHETRAAIEDTPALVPAHNRPVAHNQARTTADLLQQAIEQSSAYREPTVTSRPIGRQLLALGCAVVVAAGLLGFIAVHNISGVRLQLASAKAGFSAATPGYKAAGFRAAGTQSVPGAIVMRYQSNSDDRHYSITEKNSAWDSQTLVENFVDKTSSNHRTEQVGGRTVYLYGNAAATWVSGGVWYQVQSDGALSGHQLLDLASSL